MTKYPAETYWAFAWSKGTPYITSIVRFTRDDLIKSVTKEMNTPWRKLYGQGGRAIKVTIQQKDPS